MITFKEQIALDNSAVFINMDEFAEEHDLNGSICKCILQDISVADNLSTAGSADLLEYAGVFGSRVQVNCLKGDLPEEPVNGQAFHIDGKYYLVESCADDMGVLTIQLVANER